MVRLRSIRGVLPIALSGLLVGLAAAQQPKCKIEIRAPKTGDRVTPRAVIRGVAAVPAGMFLWVVVHKEGLTNWWPQGGGSVKPKPDGTWVVEGVFGDERRKEIGNFEITALIVDEDGHRALKDYVKTSEKENAYPGTELPAVPDGGCSLKTEIVVQRQ